jgi:uncharacterized repeat protein (TIGR01451 family)
VLAALSATAAATPTISNTKSLAGNINYVVTGGSLRTQPNGVDPCAVQATSSAAISGVPSGATIRAAYLYFVGDGDTPDYDITFNGTPLSADTQYNDTLTFLGENYNYFGGVVDVTAYVGGNGTYTFGGLNAQVTDTPGGALYCSYQGVIAGWGLVVVYEKATEPLRVINIFDGLEHFYGSSIALNPGNFKVPASGIDGKMTVITWGGDDDISTAQNGLNETLRFNGNSLTDGYNPANNQYNSTINTLPSTTSWGVDIDTYDVSAYLSAGQTSATSLFSTGADDIYLTAQVISVTNEPVADLSIDSAHTGSWLPGGSGSYTLTVHNNGPQAATGTTTVTDTIPSGLTYVSASGTGWTCGFSAPTVTCTTSSSVADGASLPAITVGVTVDAGAPASVDNTATVANAIFDNVAGNNTDTDTTTILHPVLSANSTKTVVDLNGGDADPGDTLRYTITLAESAGAPASNVSVTDDIPANVTGFTVVSTPGGSTDASTGGGGANGTGYLDVTGISVPASGTATIVFDVTVAGGATPGTAIDNTATINVPGGGGGDVSAPTVIVSQSQIAASGNKVLYPYDNGTLTRTPQAADTTTPITVNGGASTTWTMTPAVATGKSLQLPAQTVTVELVIAPSGTGLTGTNGNRRPTTVSLLNGGTLIATSPNVFIVGNSGTQLRTYSITIPATTVNAGTGLNLRFNNNHGTANRRVAVSQRVTGTGASAATFTASTVVNVDSVALYSAAYPSAATLSSYTQGTTVYIRAVASDPFGSYDVSGATLKLTDANGVVRANNLAMTQVADSGVATRTFEYAYALAGDAAVGNWTASVTAQEGAEGTVTHVANTAFLVGLPVLSVAKSHTGDFVAGSNGSYSIVVTNNSLSTVAGTTTVTDTLPAGLSYVSATGTGWSCSAAGQDVTCTNGSGVPASGSLPAITLTVAVAGSAGASVDNQAQVANPNVNAGAAQPGNIDTATVLHPDLSGSGTTKEVVDLNGGDAAPGDTLRYTITLAESAGVAASNVSVTDDIPANVTGFTVVSTPGGSTDASTGGGGANGTGYLDVTGISVPANGTATIVFDVTVAGGATAGTTINNTATVTNPNGPGAAPVAPLVTVLQSQVAAAGDKVLYVYGDLSMSRTRQPGNGTAAIGEASTVDFTLAGVKKPLVLTPTSTVTVSLITYATGTIGSARTVQVQLYKNGTTQIGTAAGTTPNFTSATPTLRTFTFTVGGGGVGSLAAGDTLVLRVTNVSAGNGTRSIAVDQYDGSNRSTVSFATTTVINVDSAAAYSLAYPSVATSPRYLPGGTVYVRAVISDPFGSDDVNHATATITDPTATVKVNAAPMNLVAEDTANGTRTYEYTYSLPSNARLGSWTASVKGYEGVENTITHTGNASFDVEGTITLDKAWGGSATAGDTVSLTISGGSTATAGSSTAPATTTAATATSAAGATITLAEAYTVGDPGTYTPSLTCTKVTDASPVVVSGTGLGRTISMPSDSSVACTWNNSKTVPLNVVKASLVRSDPINGTTNPKAIPGAVVRYQVIVTNPATTPVDADTIVFTDPLPPQVEMRVADLAGAGSGPVTYIDGSPASGMTYTFVALGDFGDDIDFSSDGGATWTYVPVPDADGFDPAVDAIRVNPKGAFNANNAQFTLKFRVRIK